jgi:lysophospholipase L1-like esterase
MSRASWKVPILYNKPPMPWILLLVALAGCGNGSERQTTPASPASTTTVPAAARVRIMPLGDSITQADSEHDSYRRPLFKSLELEGRSVDFVGSLSSNFRGGPPRRDFDLDHEGHWGFRVDEILEDVRRWVLAEEPDVLLVHLGSNDVFQDQSVSSTLDELSRLIDVVREVRPDADFLVAQILPTNNPSRNRTLRQLNASIASLASKSTERSRVAIVDQFTGFDPERMTYDGVHPNAEGEIHMADRWLAALERYFGERQRW